MSKKIVIIGAGPSGIAAATRLIENGLTDVTILEAEDRIGGRVNTIAFDDGVIELGAQFCHGNQNNAVYDLASKHGLLNALQSDFTEFSVHDTDGTQIPTSKSIRLIELGEKILEEDMSSYKGSKGNYFMERYWEELKDEKYNDIDDKLRNQYAKLLHKFQNSYDGTDTWYLTSSADTYEDPEGTGGNFIWNTKSRGYATIFDLLQKKFPTQNNPIDITANVQLKKVVNKISYSLTESTSQVRIECSDGSTYDADHLICTVSLGVLKKRHLQLFDPILPLKKSEAIETVNFGVVNKVFLEFERPFWPSDWAECGVVWSPEQLKEIRACDDSRWLEGVMLFQTLENHPNLLYAWVCGPNTREMETRSEETVAKQMIRLLKLCLRDFDIPNTPKRVLRSQWFSNPHFLGSYSSCSVVADGMNVSHADIAEPLLNADKRPVIQFAGEATSVNHYSTVHGAIDSGWREADRLINFYKK